MIRRAEDSPGGFAEVIDVTKLDSVAGKLTDKRRVSGTLLGWSANLPEEPMNFLKLLKDTVSKNIIKLDTVQAAILIEKLKIFSNEMKLRNIVAENYNKLIFHN